MGTMTKVAECVLCHEVKRIFSRNRCQACYQRERAAALRGSPCGACGRSGMALTCRGLCQPCRAKLPPGLSYAVNKRVRIDTPDELQAAKEREKDFLEQVLPAVQNHAENVFRRWRPDEREEAMLEAAALAWRHFVRMLADGYEPLRSLGYIAKTVVKTVRAWDRLTGVVAKNDVLSPRARYNFEVDVVSESMTNPERRGGFDDLLASGARRMKSVANEELCAMDYDEWAQRLSRVEREFLACLSELDDDAEIAERFNTTRRDVQDARELLCEQFVEYARS